MRREPFLAALFLVLCAACGPRAAAPPLAPASAPIGSSSPSDASNTPTGAAPTTAQASAASHEGHATDAHDTAASATSTDKTASGSPAPIIAALEPRSNSNVTGSVTLTPVSEGVRVQVRVRGATPGLHGLHFHEHGDCSAPDATSAKGHYNPTSQPHALPTDAKRHLGDMGNLIVGSNGEGSLEITLEGATLVPNAPNSLLGRAIILHADKDDGSQPTGNSGARIGCAVIAR